MEHWSHQFCLACDKQVDSNAAYCTEACRLAELERSTPSSQASSPGMTPPSYPWSSPSTKTSSKFFLEPAYDFSNAQPYGASTTARQHALFGDYSLSASTQTQPSSLTPSSSGTSLSSMQSAPATNDASNISADAMKELRAYAMAFEYARSQRRRSS